MGSKKMMNAVERQCSGTAKKKKRCKIKAFSRQKTFYCDAHADQRTEKEEDDDEDDGIIPGSPMSTEKNIEPGVSDAQTLPKQGDASTQESSAAEEKNENRGIVIEAARSDLSESMDAQNSDDDHSYAFAASSSSDSEAMDHRVAVDVPADELEFFEDDAVPENLVQLHEIADPDVVSDADSTDDEEQHVNTAAQLKRDAVSSEPSQWAWKSSREERWELVCAFIEVTTERVIEFSRVAEDFVDSARKKLAEKSATSLKKARVIGATVVGATRRLHALRASEPFAMIVEEACENLEPTLLSVLSVRSLCKLELIGDHRQLPAFVNPCWFNVQMTNPSIKVSLFQRLVENCAASCSILDVRRRMRGEICALTRVEYEDVVKIQDEKCTVTQRISDRVLRDVRVSASVRKMAKSERDKCAEGGKLVPGVLPQVYFWDVDSEQGRAAVGISGCNMIEARACVGLIKCLVQCGVPAAAIAVISPYKGRVLTIMRMLRKEKSSPVSNDFVSTVDRYQGDENDIVILSLVSTQPGNRFVTLRNRFIVSASHARIGLFILGKSKVVSNRSVQGPGPSHWVRLLRDLESSPNSGETTRIGKALPICCPPHR